MTRRAVLLLTSLALILIAVGCFAFVGFEMQHRYDAQYEWMFTRLTMIAVSFTMLASGATGIGLFVAALFAIRSR